jgi:putative SOS response-associated peptidase YedK
MRNGKGVQMCGRYTQTADPAELQEFFQIDQIETAKLTANYNITPSSDVYVVDELSGSRQLRIVQWGLIPGWQRDIKTARPMINARSESASEKPYFRDSFKTSRAIVPATGWYEWKTIGLADNDKTKQPFYLSGTSTSQLAFAGLLSAVRLDSGEWLRTVAILTTGPCPELLEIHDRMPVILQPDAWSEWLNPKSEVESLKQFFHPTSAGSVTAYPVSQQVNSNRAAGPELIAPIAL